jgi:IclR family transcriptional regulator, pca regulon regulatory protein
MTRSRAVLGTEERGECDLGCSALRIMPSPDPRFSRSLEYGTAILECFTGARPVLRVSELAEMVRLSRATTHRYAATLVKLGYLEQDDKRRYRLARPADRPGVTAIETIRREVRARTILEDLRAQTGHTVSLGLLDGTRVVYLYRLAAHGAGQYEADGVLRVGARVSALSTAIGKALLSSLLDSELLGLFPILELDRVLPETPSEGYDRHEIEAERQLIGEIEQATPAAAGFALSDGGVYGEDARSIAAPVTRWIDKPILAVELTVPASTHTSEDLVERFAVPVKHAAKLIS